jgi:hypothetical protein
MSQLIIYSFIDGTRLAFSLAVVNVGVEISEPLLSLLWGVCPKVKIQSAIARP